MRLICPNCGAQYDVPKEVIPQGGRDVQCSNCGHTWYQSHPDQDAALAEDLGRAVPDPEWAPEDEAPVPPSRPAPRAAVQAPPATAPSPRPAPVPPAVQPEAAAPQATPETRSIDPEMAELFREEREYEARLRAADSIETQPDLGLTAPDEDEQARRSRQARERMARLRGEEAVTPRPAPRRPATPEAAPASPPPSAPPATAAAAAAGSRRDLLPDVDEINQTLRSSSPPRMIDAAERSQAPLHAEKSGFGKGFIGTVLLAGGAVATYVFGQDIGAQVPALEPYLQMYTASVDDGRVWLSGQVDSLLKMLDTMSSEATSSPPAPSEGS